MAPNNEYNQKIIQTVQWIKQSHHLVLFTGAGISTESGIPDYRGPNGVWTRRDKGLPPPSMKKPWNQIDPNQGHIAIVELQNRGYLKFLISQNVDNLHIKSGINPELIAELHGNHTLMRCLQCERRFLKEGFWDENKWGQAYRTDPIMPNQPNCPECGGRIISSIINFKDSLPEKEINLAFQHSALSDVFIVIGSSLQVTPAALMPVEAKKNGAKIIIINHQATGHDEIADLRFYENSGQILTDILSDL
jgi:mono-ADP-ribosyltransferase sirtuin 6